ncbi:hypothetical protein LIS04_192 [Listeria phage LIS04]|nr:hypothetical protein LIS04_192 [Listeria phage LIS04]
MSIERVELAVTRLEFQPDLNSVEFKYLSLINDLLLTDVPEEEKNYRYQLGLLQANLSLLPVRVKDYVRRYLLRVKEDSREMREYLNHIDEVPQPMTSRGVRRCIHIIDLDRMSIHNIGVIQATGQYSYPILAQSLEVQSIEDIDFMEEVEILKSNLSSVTPAAREVLEKYLSLKEINVFEIDPFTDKILER